MASLNGILLHHYQEDNHPRQRRPWINLHSIQPPAHFQYFDFPFTQPPNLPTSQPPNFPTSKPLTGKHLCLKNALCPSNKEGFGVYLGFSSAATSWLIRTAFSSKGRKPVPNDKHDGKIINL
jgi:hypothetical protein